MDKRLKVATLLAIGGTLATSASAVGAAPTKSCDNGDELITANWTIGQQMEADDNENGLVCEHIDRYRAPKKKGPGYSISTYYDDRL